MVHLAQIEYLLIIAVIPFLFLLHFVMQYRKKVALRSFGDPILISKLMPQRSTRRGWVKLIFFSIALFFFAIGLSRPQIGARVKEVERKGAEIMIALDVSNSMLAQDYSPNRLERAKLAISRLVDRLQQDRIGLIVFAGDAFVQLPITTDYVSAKIFLNSISTESIRRQGTALGEAIITGLRSFSSTAENSKALILITDGENHEDDALEAAKLAKESGVRIFCIGIGSEQGKAIPMPDGNLLKDENGNIVVTKLDEASLVEIARIGDGSYVRAGNSEFGLETIVDGVRELDKQTFSSEVFEDFNEQYMYFFGIALFFLLIEFLIHNKKRRWMKSLEVFSRLQKEDSK
ncbi:MAG: VWA domain-containing protein [Prevotellaceae bacterium]|jgi:Ca-activated chloride channel family protein|nr:VWA domain-containing protein [Prevotellaceae bacterium]